MKLRQPTRWLNVKTTPTETTAIKTSGKIHEGFRTIDSKVGFGLNSTPKIRPKELSELVVAGEGVSALAMLVSSCCTRNDRGTDSLSHYGWLKRMFQSGATV
jgi:hypothetical protein